MKRAGTVFVLVSLLGCDEVSPREDAQAVMEAAALDPSATAVDGGPAEDRASADPGAFTDNDASVPSGGDAASDAGGAASQRTDAAPQPADAAVPVSSDGGRAYTYAEVQPIFKAKCTPCHAADAGTLVPFAGAYDSLGRASKLCPGEVVSACIPRVVAIETMEGAGCRTVQAPFHREAWPCLSGDERTAILGWKEP